MNLTELEAAVMRLNRHVDLLTAKMASRVDPEILKELQRADDEAVKVSRERVQE